MDEVDDVAAADVPRRQEGLLMVERGLPEDMPAHRRLQARLGRHVQWARRDGVARLIEEDRLDPRERVTDAWRSWRWRQTHGFAPGSAGAAFVLGVQRSGTNMVLRGLETRPEVEVRNENDRATFRRYQLREDPVIERTVGVSRHQLVMFKPLCDSHRALHLLDGLRLPQPARVVWVYRGADARARSAVAKFGDVNRTVLAQIATGEGTQRWQAQGWSEATTQLVRQLDPARLSPEAGAALFWLVRNRLFLDQGLDQRDDVLLVSYERFVAEPAETSRRLATFLGVEWSPSLHAHADQRAGSPRPPLELPPLLRDACTELAERLDELERTASQHG